MNNNDLQTVVDIEFAVDDTNSAPEFKAVRGKDWVPYGYNNDNQYPDRLMELANNSALHGAIIRSKSQQVAGGGFIFDDTSSKASATSSFLAEINDEEDANEILTKIAYDLEVFGGYALLCTWSRDWRKITKVEHIDFSKIRATKTDVDGKIKGYYYSYDWSKQRPLNPQYIPTFNRGKASENSKNYKNALETINKDMLAKLAEEPTLQIMVYKPYKPNCFYYPLPSYVGAINAIEADIQSDEYSVNILKNGMTIEYILDIKGITDPAARKREAKAILSAHQAAKNAGKPFITFSKDDNQGVSITKLQSSGEDKRYTSINANSLQKILSGHGVVSPMLVGIKTEGSLGGSQEIETAFQIFLKTVITPSQIAITKGFNKILRINGLESVSIKQLTLLDVVDSNESQEKGNNNTDIKQEDN